MIILRILLSDAEVHFHYMIYYSGYIYIKILIASFLSFYFKIIVLLSSVFPLIPDKDECTLEPDICGQNCSNTIGSYLCSCIDGYRLSIADQRSCDGEQNFNLELYNRLLLFQHAQDAL